MSVCLVSILSEGMTCWEARTSLWMSPPESEFGPTVSFVAYMNVIVTSRTQSYRTTFSTHIKINKERSTMTEFVFKVVLKLDAVLSHFGALKTEWEPRYSSTSVS